MTGSDNTVYDVDHADLGAASYYVTSETRWGVSNVGKFNQAPNDSNIIYSSNQKFQNAADSELFQTARMSASSLRYYGLGLENGNYCCASVCRNWLSGHTDLAKPRKESL